MKPPASLRRRLLWTFVGGMVVSAALVAGTVAVLVRPFNSYLLERGADRFVHGLARQVQFDASGQPVGLTAKVEPWMFNSMGQEVAMRVVDDTGRVAFAPDADARSLISGQREPGQRPFTLVRDGVAMHAAVATLQHGGREWQVQFAVSDRLMDRMRDSIGLPALSQGMLALCVVFLLVFLVTVHITLRRALAPLSAASEAARRITPRTLDERMSEAQQPVEIRPMVQAFNQALDRLAHGFRTQQEFLASAAHELKTPLALIRAQVELGPHDERRTHLLQDVDRMARQVQQLLLLAEVSEPQNYRIEAIDPLPTVREAFDFMARVAERRGVYLGLRVGNGVRQWNADRSALFTLLKNLLENAIQHSPAGGVVALTVRPDGFGVSDEGPGVRPEHLSRLFDRFWRAPGGGSDGAGLGLAICAEIATAHGWRIVPHMPDRGLEMAVRMGP
ncbi:sensor histidine kinase [Roseateles sp. BYS96W]|uniref:histidine kinase n=1 Tax=Pelomonas nitida TaxID=3299027 RepID=A0ABW7GBK7_9BURK